MIDWWHLLLDGWRQNDSPSVTCIFRESIFVSQTIFSFEIKPIHLWSLILSIPPAVCIIASLSSMLNCFNAMARNWFETDDFRLNRAFTITAAQTSKLQSQPYCLWIVHALGYSMLCRSSCNSGLLLWCISSRKVKKFEWALTKMSQLIPTDRL